MKSSIVVLYKYISGHINNSTSGCIAIRIDSKSKGPPDTGLYVLNKCMDDYWDLNGRKFWLSTVRTGDPWSNVLDKVTRHKRVNTQPTSSRHFVAKLTSPLWRLCSPACRSVRHFSLLTMKKSESRVPIVSGETAQICLPWGSPSLDFTSSKTATIEVNRLFSWKNPRKPETIRKETKAIDHRFASPTTRLAPGETN